MMPRVSLNIRGRTSVFIRDFPLDLYPLEHALIAAPVARDPAVMKCLGAVAGRVFVAAADPNLH